MLQNLFPQHIQAFMEPTVARNLIERYESLPAQLRRAARWIIDNPREVALTSMRAQARAAGVQPATMTRLAQALGLDGYESLRADYAATLRAVGDGLSDTAADRLSKTTSEDDNGIAARLLREPAAQLAALADGDLPAQLTEAARRIAGARRVYCLGRRSSAPVAWQLHYALSLADGRGRLLDGFGGTGVDALHDAGPEDVMIAVGVRPYTREVVAATRLARSHGVHVVALTDSRVSPLLKRGDTGLVVSTAGVGFLHALTPAFAVAEALAALAVREAGPAALERLRGLDAQHSALDTYLNPKEPTEP